MTVAQRTVISAFFAKSTKWRGGGGVSDALHRTNDCDSGKVH